MVVVRHVLRALLRLLRNPACAGGRVRVKIWRPRDDRVWEQVRVSLSGDRRAEEAAHVLIRGACVV